MKELKGWDEQQRTASFCPRCWLSWQVRASSRSSSSFFLGAHYDRVPASGHRIRRGLEVLWKQTSFTSGFFLGEARRNGLSSGPQRNRKKRNPKTAHWIAEGGYWQSANWSGQYFVA